MADVAILHQQSTGDHLPGSGGNNLGYMDATIHGTSRVTPAAQPRPAPPPKTIKKAWHNKPLVSSGEKPSQSESTPGDLMFDKGETSSSSSKSENTKTSKDGIEIPTQEVRIPHFAYVFLPHCPLCLKWLPNSTTVISNVVNQFDFSGQVYNHILFTAFFMIILSMHTCCVILLLLIICEFFLARFVLILSLSLSCRTGS